MALRDLVANKSALTEEAIETIVSEFVRYDADSGEIVLTPAGVTLKNDQKILVYLTAVQGWPFVTDSPPDVRTRPADLETALGIAGGTLRPVLKILKDGHLIVAHNGSYGVRLANLDGIHAVLRGENGSVPKRRTGGAKRKRPKHDESAGPKKPSGLVAAKIAAWATSGYFDVWRTLKEVHQHLHEQGIIVPQTAVSGPLLRAVQQDLLRRKKQIGDRKAVWIYRSSERQGD